MQRYEVEMSFEMNDGQSVDESAWYEFELTRNAVPIGARDARVESVDADAMRVRVSFDATRDDAARWVDATGQAMRDA